MSTIEVLPARTRREREIFLTFPWRIYAGDPLWVPPLLSERRKTIDPARGVFFQRGDAEFFIAWRDGAPVGTICAAEDKAYNSSMGKRECMFGFFEWVPDQAVALALIKHVARWAAARGLALLGGPFNLDYEDGYGVLVEGRDRPPVVLCGHTPPYYLPFFERLGFTPLRGDNIAYEIPLDTQSAALQRTAFLAERIRKNGWITIRTPNLDRWMDEVDVVQELLNKALAHLPDFRPWEREAVVGLLEPFKSLADPDLVLFAEVKGKTIGFFPGIANMNEVLIHLNGLRYPWDFLRALRWMRYKPRCVTIKSVLILPEYWGGGAALLLIDEMARRARAKGYEWADLSLTSDDNPYTPELATRMGARIYKRYRVYGKPVEEILSTT
ncbi:MAG: GNAT family N-acetyltransferase [Spirochaetia bacterium]